MRPAAPEQGDEPRDPTTTLHPKGSHANDSSLDRQPSMAVLVMTANAVEVVGAEANRLAVCEAIIDEGLRTFVEVGTALATIRDERLYRATHTDFASYAQARFGLGKAYAHRVIGAAKVKLSPIGDTISNEAQARELVPLLDDPERMREIVERAQASGKITAASLRAARRYSTADATRARVPLPPTVARTPRQRKLSPVETYLRLIEDASAVRRAVERLVANLQGADIDINDHARRTACELLDQVSSGLDLARSLVSNGATTAEDALRDWSADDGRGAR